MRADFRPQAGVVSRYMPPGGLGVRIESHLYGGYEVPSYYDSLLGKLIVWGPDRDTAIARSRVALDEFVVDGLETNIPFHRALLHDETLYIALADTAICPERRIEAITAGFSPMTFLIRRRCRGRLEGPLPIPGRLEATSRRSAFH